MTCIRHVAPSVKNLRFLTVKASAIRLSLRSRAADGKGTLGCAKAFRPTTHVAGAHEGQRVSPSDTSRMKRSLLFSASQEEK